jgi:hypothetical protein
MADLQDVLNTLASQIGGFVYPNGTGQASVSGQAINIFPGWPLPDQIDSDMPQGIADISIFPTPTERNTTRYRPQQKVMSVATPTLTLTANGNVVTVGGVMPSPFTAHNLAVLVNKQPFIYPVQPTDTLTSIATGLATLLAVAFPGTTSSGPVITLPANTVPIVARVGTTGTVTTEWERQQQLMQVTVWAPDPTTRATIGNAIKVALSQIAFLTMPDGYGARILYKGNRYSDDAQKPHIYRRDFFYEVEYATTVTQTIATVVAAKVTFETQDGTPIITRTY